MTIRADVAALVDAGHSDAYIAFRLGCHRSTANRHRRDLNRARSAERSLYVEELPTGRVLEYRPARQPISPAQAAANRATLAAALRESRTSRLSAVYPARPAKEAA